MNILNFVDQLIKVAPDSSGHYEVMVQLPGIVQAADVSLITLSSDGNTLIIHAQPVAVQPQDVNAEAAAQLFGVPVDQVTPDMYERAKTILFALKFAPPTGG